MQFTVRGLLSYIVLVSASLALAQLPFLVGCGLLVLAIIFANFVLPPNIWRVLAYGAFAGIFASELGLFAYFGLTTTRPHSYTDGRLEIVYATRPYIIQLGALVGATAGLAWSKRKSVASADG